MILEIAAHWDRLAQAGGGVEQNAKKILWRQQ